MKSDSLRNELNDLLRNKVDLHNLLGIRFLEIGPTTTTILVPYNKKLFGDVISKRVHGGIIGLAMDSAGSAICLQNFTNLKDKLSTVSLHIEFLNRAKQEDIIIEARLKKKGSKLIFIEMTAYHSGEETVALVSGSGVYNLGVIHG